MAHFHGSTHFRFDESAIAGGSLPLPLRSILNNAVYKAVAVIRMGRATKPDKIIAAKATKAEAADQLPLLAALDPDGIEMQRLIDIRRFERETERMRGKS